MDVAQEECTPIEVSHLHHATRSRRARTRERDRRVLCSQPLCVPESALRVLVLGRLATRHGASK
jgi:hypothetical protein